MAMDDHFTMGEKAVRSALARGLNPHAIAEELSTNTRFVNATLTGLRFRYGAKTIAELAEKLRSGAEPVLLRAPVGHHAPTTDEIDERDLWCNQERFLGSLGVERIHVPCRVEGCAAGALFQSVMCRHHHIEMLKRASEPGTKLQ